jgi:hypothetical protein
VPERPIIVFDVNETLLDLEAIRPVFDRIFNDPAAMRLCGLCETPAILSSPTLVRNASEHGDTPHQIIGNGFPDR